MLNVHENFFPYSSKISNVNSNTPSNINELLQSHCTAVIFECETFRDTTMNCNREILNFVRNERLDVVEELQEKELQLLDITQKLYQSDKTRLC